MQGKGIKDSEIKDEEILKDHLLPAFIKELKYQSFNIIEIVPLFNIFAQINLIQNTEFMTDLFKITDKLG